MKICFMIMVAINLLLLFTLAICIGNSRPYRKKLDIAIMCIAIAFLISTANTIGYGIYVLIKLM